MPGNGKPALQNSTQPVSKIKKICKTSLTNIKGPIKRKKVACEQAAFPSPRMTPNSVTKVSRSPLHTDSHVATRTPKNEITPVVSINQTKNHSICPLSELKPICSVSNCILRTEGCNSNISEPSQYRPYPKGDTRFGVCVKITNFGATAEQGVRRTMEDQHVMLGDGIPFFAIYDGHGGAQCAEYLRDHLHKLILGHPEIMSSPEKAISDSIIKMDADFLERPEEDGNESGSVCVVVIVIDDTLVIGNVGDCEAVLCRGGSPIVPTVKHTLQSNTKELERVHDAGGKIFHNRVGHPRFNPSVISLGVTRAIGDAGFKLAEYTDGKPSGIISQPDTTSIKLTSGDEFLVVGSDGLWDVMSYEEVIDFCSRRLKSGETAQSITDELTQAALNKGATDNVTTMLICLECYAKDPQGGEFIYEGTV
ncbi:unnamed protein product [Phytomonas sp. Hart1]|nr:unnamed protein product [Phytomonas sp. Hart1]|eukprot:CCW66531.1 unnamed protein product [Phytomonas sp. isolate Hart1]